jgi:hypothetical protein
VQALISPRIDQLRKSYSTDGGDLHTRWPLFLEKKGPMETEFNR